MYILHPLRQLKAGFFHNAEARMMYFPAQSDFGHRGLECQSHLVLRKVNDVPLGTKLEKRSLTPIWPASFQ